MSVTAVKIKSTRMAHRLFPNHSRVYKEITFNQYRYSRFRETLIL